MNESQPAIILLIPRRGWTLSAIHAACQLAREFGARFTGQDGWRAALKLAWGTELGYMGFTFEEQAEMTEYEEIIAEYDVEFTGLYLSICKLIQRYRPNGRASQTTSSLCYTSAQLIWVAQFSIGQVTPTTSVL